MHDNLLKHGSMLFIATGASAFLGYLYHLLMGRMLGPAEYGALASIFTFIYIFAPPTGLSGAIQLGAAREIARLKAKGKPKELLDYSRYLARNVFLLALAVFIVFLAASPLVAGFLHVELMPVVLLAALLFFYLLLVVPWSLLQGTERFFPYGISSFLQALVKLAAALGLVLFGFGVSGAVGGVITGVIVAGGFCAFYLRDFLKPLEEKPARAFSFFSWGILLSLLFLMLMVNIDIILVKHFFSAEEAGQYSIASLLGKLIYFLAISFATVLLPMVSESADRQRERALLKKSLAITACFAFALLFAFWFFSRQIVLLFFGPAYAPSAEILPLFGIVMALFSFSNILVYFEMGLKRNSHVAPLAAFCVFEAAGLWFFHASLQQVLVVVAAANALLLAVLLLNYYWKR